MIENLILSRLDTFPWHFDRLIKKLWGFIRGTLFLGQISSRLEVWVCVFRDPYVFFHINTRHVMYVSHSRCSSHQTKRSLYCFCVVENANSGVAFLRHERC